MKGGGSPHNSIIHWGFPKRRFRTPQANWVRWRDSAAGGVGITKMGEGVRGGVEEREGQIVENRTWGKENPLQKDRNHTLRLLSLVPSFPF